MNNDDIPPEIERQMKIKPMPPLPERVEGHLTLEQVKNFGEGDRAILIAISKVEQLVKFSYTAVSVAIDQARKSEAEMVEKTNRIKNGLRWVGGVVLVAVVGAVALKFIHP